VHLLFSENIFDMIMCNFKAVVFLYRDPADICVSMAHYMDVVPSFWFNQRVSADLYVQDLSLEERILFYVDNYGRLFGYFTGWKDAPVLQVRYESLMRNTVQEMSVLRDYMCRFGVDVDSVMRMVALCTKKNVLAWRSGKIGEHKKWFDPDDHRLSLSGFTDAREKLGYG